jgi:hypothetical protein
MPGEEEHEMTVSAVLASVLLPASAAGAAAKLPLDWLSFKLLCTLFLPAGKWTVQQAAELSVAAPTITSSLDGRYMSALKDQRVAAAKVFGELGLKAPVAVPGIDKAQLVADVGSALYCSKICSYAQGMNIIKAKSEEKAWGVDLGGLARIWKVSSRYNM